MVIKKLLVGVIFLISVVLFAGNVFAISCNVAEIGNCDAGVEGVLMSLSDNTNAHGAIRGAEGNYGQHVCCDFEGTKNCFGSNDLKVSLSQDTNAHGELTSVGTTEYDEDLCFGALECISGSETDCTSGGYNLEVASLSQDTNAHLAEFDSGLFGDGYDAVKICCKWEANAYWADPNSPDEVKTVAAVGDTVVLVLNNSGLNIGASVFSNFIIKENDGAIDDTILPRTGGNTITGNTVVTEETRVLLSGEWFIQLEDYNEGKDCVGGIVGECAPDEFYFIANGIESSGYLKIIEIDEGITYCDGFVDEDMCNVCDNSDCSAAYNSKNNYLISTEGVGCGELVPGNENYKFNCFCEWDVDDGVCNSATSTVSVIDTTAAPHCVNGYVDNGEVGIDCGDPIGNCGVCVEIDGVLQVAPHCKDGMVNASETGLDCGGVDCGPCSYSISFPRIGSCSYVSIGTDDCADGFLDYSWIGNWTWGSNNGFDSTDNDFSNMETDYVDVGGTWYYDPLRMSNNCVGGNNVITCPAQIQLPFFGFFGFLTSLILVSIIYGFLVFRKK